MFLLPIRRQPVAARATAIRARQRLWLVTVLLVVLAADQATKAWAWRNVPIAHINSGAGLVLGPQLADWYRGGVRGRLVDAAGTALLVGLGLLLVRRHRSMPTFLGIALVLSGWASNLADRLLLHTVTAPGSARGVVDFLRWNGRLWNVADLVIIAGAALGVVAWLLDGFRRRPLPVARERIESAYPDASGTGPRVPTYPARR